MERSTCAGPEANGAVQFPGPGCAGRPRAYGMPGFTRRAIGEIHGTAAFAFGLPAPGPVRTGNDGAPGEYAAPGRFADHGGHAADGRRLYLESPATIASSSASRSGHTYSTFTLRSASFSSSSALIVVDSSNTPSSSSQMLSA